MAFTKGLGVLGFGLFVLGVGVGSHGLTQTRSSPVIEAQEIRIVDSAGRVRGRWGFRSGDSGEFEFVLADERGEERIRMGIDNEDRVRMSLRAGGNGPSFGIRAYPGELSSAYVRSNSGSIGIAVSEDGNPRLTIRDYGERERVILELSSDNLPRLRLWDYTGLRRIDIGCREGPSQEPIPCFVQVLDENEVPLASLP